MGKKQQADGPIECAPVIYLELVVHEGGDYHNRVLDRLPVAVLKGGINELSTSPLFGGVSLKIDSPDADISCRYLERHDGQPKPPDRVRKRREQPQSKPR